VAAQVAASRAVLSSTELVSWLVNKNLHQIGGNSIFILLTDLVSSGLLRRVALVRTDVSDEPGASFIRVTKISELGTTQVATSNRRTLRRDTGPYKSHTA
jgi:hypothetical protein